MRVFAAIPLSAAATERLLSLRLRLSHARDGLRWSSPEQWHVTLQFFGELDETSARRVQEIFERLRGGLIEMEMGSLGLFAAKGILYATIEPTTTLVQLQAEVQQIGVACGFEAPSQPFRPHITLARSKGKAGHRTLQEMARPKLPSLGPPLRWLAEEGLLLESVLRPTGAEYAVLARLPLQRHAATLAGAS